MVGRGRRDIKGGMAFVEMTGILGGWVSEWVSRSLGGTRVEGWTGAGLSTIQGNNEQNNEPQHTNKNSNYIYF